MMKNKLIDIKKRLVALSLAGVMLGTAGCYSESTSNNEENGIPQRVSIPQDLSSVEDYYKYIIQDGNALKVYKGENVYLLYDKETYNVAEYIYYGNLLLGGLVHIVQVYDLPTEELVVYGDGFDTYNSEYYDYIRENNYQVCLSEISDYIEGYVGKEYYSLEEIRELEPQIANSLKIINNTKVKSK